MLVQFIKRNPKLIHLNLSSTGLTEVHLREFGDALRKSKSLRALHLDGNQITHSLVDFLISKTNGIKVGKQKYIDF